MMNTLLKKKYILQFYCLLTGLALTAAVALTSSSALNSTKARTHNVQVKGLALSIQKHDPRVSSDLSDLITGTPDGTELSVLLSFDNKRIFSLDDSKSRVISFKDEKGLDLTKENDSQWGMERTNSFDTQFSKDGRTCLMTFTAPKAPSANAEKINLKANLTFHCGSAPETREQLVPLRTGSQFNQNPLALKVGSIKAGREESSSGITLTLESKQKLDRIIKIVFTDSNGKPIASRSMGNGASSDDGVTLNIFNVRYELPYKLKQVRMRITYYSKIELLSVPLDLTYGVGL